MSKEITHLKQQDIGIDSFFRYIMEEDLFAARDTAMIWKKVLRANMSFRGYMWNAVSGGNLALQISIITPSPEWNIMVAASYFGDLFLSLETGKPVTVDGEMDGPKYKPVTKCLTIDSHRSSSDLSSYFVNINWTQKKKWDARLEM